MPRVSNSLRCARMLAEFADLERTGVHYFRRKYPDFVPDAWWDYHEGKQWQMTQKFIREAWQEGFPSWTDENAKDAYLAYFLLRRLLDSVFDPNQIDDQKTTFVSLYEIADTYLYHRAIFWLFSQPWRAKKCLECEKRFVATNGKNEYCSYTLDEEGRDCFQRNRNRQKLRSYFNKKANKAA